jgi:hypothetical protein
MVLSIDDMFTTGAGLDVAGAYLLGRGLLTSHSTIMRRTRTRVGGSSPTAAGQLADRVDAIAGIATLGAGFFVQATSYVLVIAFGWSAGVGWVRAVVAAAFGVCVLAVAVGLDRATHWRRLRSQIVEYARHDETGQRHEKPSGSMLIYIGQEFHRYPKQNEVLPGGTLAYARRVFAVRELREDTAGEILGGA